MHARQPPQFLYTRPLDVREIALPRYAVLLTGPSAAADIEGVLVRGARGVRSLTVLALLAP